MNCKNQRGAAALMIVLFLLVVGSVAVLTALSTSGSDAGDTAYQHNSVAALDLAESGLERVAGRLSTGATCASLGTEGPYTLGLGNFSVVTPAPYLAASALSTLSFQSIPGSGMPSSRSRTSERARSMSATFFAAAGR